jgi:glycerol-3-phosphate dehydrogenase (NAD(P)+)
MKFGVIGSGSWATALAKILTDNNHCINWWVRNPQAVNHIQQRHHNPQYLSAAYFDTSLLTLTTNIEEVVNASDCILLVVPSAYLVQSIESLPANIFENKKILSAIKGILPDENILLNDYLQQKFGVALHNYFTLMGPCHAEEVATEKLSYLTFSGVDAAHTANIAAAFKTYYINTIVNDDVLGVQYAAVLKNIYALGAGIAHGLEYGDNFLSVFIANAADEMALFLKKLGFAKVEVGTHGAEHPITHQKDTNYAASVYLGDLLVTCYSPFSRNRTFGNMVGKGYSVKATQLEMNMVAEGYLASRCMHVINQHIGADMPVATTIYKILWQNMAPTAGFNFIESILV